MLYIAGLTINGFILALLLLKKDRQRADNILLAWMAVVAVHFVLFYSFHTGFQLRHPHLLGLGLAFPVLHGVFLYWYTAEETGSPLARSKWMAIHFIPFIALVLLAMPFYLLPAEEKLRVYQEQGKGFEWYMAIHRVVVLASGFIYPVFGLLRIYRHRRWMQSVLSNTDKLMLRWLETLTIGLAAIYVLVVFWNDDVVFGGVALYVLLIGFFGIYQVPVFNPAWMAGPEKSPPDARETDREPVDESPAQQGNRPGEPGDTVRYAKTGLKESDVDDIMKRLEELMRHEKPFKEYSLTLNELAGQLKIHPNQLSQVINSRTGKTFYHYVNTHRIDEFVDEVQKQENRNLKLIALAWDCGFSSKSTFNKYFRMKMGMTPSEFLAKAS